jgi:hypothetical protein
MGLGGSLVDAMLAMAEINRHLAESYCQSVWAMNIGPTGQYFAQVFQANNTKKEVKLDSMQWARLQGWCWAQHPSHIPLSWSEFLRMMNKNSQRTGITKGMDDWAIRHNKETDTDNICPDDTKMKDVMALNPNPMGRRPEFKDFARGITLLGCCP